MSLENDLALLELSSPVTLKENIIPVCLHREKQLLGGYKNVFKIKYLLIRFIAHDLSIATYLAALVLGLDVSLES